MNITFHYKEKAFLCKLIIRTVRKVKIYTLDNIDLYIRLIYNYKKGEMKMKRKIEQYWNKYTFVMSFIFFVITMPVIWAIIYPITKEWPNVWQATIKYGLSAISAYAYIILVWKKRCAIEEKPNFFKHLFSFGLLGVIGAVGAFVFSADHVDVMPKVSVFIGCVLMNLAIAISEEFIFRVVILRKMLSAWKDKKNAMWYAVISCCIIFGVRHMLNLISMPDAVVLTMAQVVFTFMAGFYLCAVYLRTENIWICVLIHFLEDFGTSVWEIFSTQAAASAGADGNMMSAVGMIMLQIPYVIFAILMLRDKTWDAHKAIPL